VGLLPAKGTVILSESPGRVVLLGNTIVGARAVASGHVIERANRVYESRSAAGLPPYPDIPQAVGVPATGYGREGSR
jgi:hypothetical protein